MRFRCFHHVPDPVAALTEFYRILRPGGLIAFSEPGPHHSLNAQSQYEMRTHGVIENDIVVADIWRMAQTIGFSDLKVSHATLPRLVDLETFDQLICASPPPKLAAAYLASDAPGQANKRCFFLYKGGAQQRIRDSRTKTGLAAAMTVTVERKGGVLFGSARLKNTGQARWLTRDGVRPGQVLLGVHHFAPDGRLVNLDYARFKLGPEPLEPGQSRVVAFELPLPPSGGFLDLDLVAEGVTWLETVGGKPVRLGPFDPA